MLFCQLGRADSLREFCNGLGCCLGRLVHVGITRAPVPLHPVLCQRAPSGNFIRGFVFYCAGALPRTNKGSVHGCTSSGSRTNCSAWIRPPSRSAYRCFPGPRSAVGLSFRFLANNVIPRDALTAVRGRICGHRNSCLRNCRPGRKDVARLPWNSVHTQAGATAILSVDGPESFRMKRPAPSDRRAIPEGSH